MSELDSILHQAIDVVCDYSEGFLAGSFTLVNTNSHLISPPIRKECEDDGGLWGGVSLTGLNGVLSAVTQPIFMRLHPAATKQVYVASADWIANQRLVEDSFCCETSSFGAFRHSNLQCACSISSYLGAKPASRSCDTWKLSTMVFRKEIWETRGNCVWL